MFGESGCHECLIVGICSCLLIYYFIIIIFLALILRLCNSYVNVKVGKLEMDMLSALMLR